VDYPKIAIIERTGKMCAPEQVHLPRELWKRGWLAESLDPQQAETHFDPLHYDLVVNRLSATSYDVDLAEPVFVRAKNWLEQAEKALGKNRVWNGAQAIQVDASKRRQQALFEKYQVGPLTQSFPDFASILEADGSAFHDRPVFLKLVAGGSGKGTLPFPSFQHLKNAIRSRSFPHQEEGCDFAALERACQRLQKNLCLLFADEPPHTVIVQQAISFDPEVEVFARFRELRPQPPMDRSRWVLRVEVWEGEVSFAAWMATTGTNYCHAEGCDAHRPQAMIRLADEQAPIPPLVRQLSIALAQDAHMRLAGIEWIREKPNAGEEGRWWAIDINGLSIMRTRYEKGVWQFKNGTEEGYLGQPTGEFYPWQRLADCLISRINESANSQLI
jgi:hypothetical protein